jgi:glucose/arabinose dehydrogenase
MLAAGAAAQEPPPVGIAPVALAAAPYAFDTAEQHGVSVTVLAKGFGRPFALEVLPGGDLLVAVRGGALLLIRTAGGTAPVAVAGMPRLDPAFANTGLHDLALHPDFAANGLVYWTWNIPVPNPAGADQRPEQGRLAVMRGRLADGRMTEVETIFETETPGYPGGSRLAFGLDGKLWVTTGAPFGEAAQDLASPYGKVLRLEADGTIPPDNPFIGRAGVDPAIYSYGHRDQHALAVHPETGAVFSGEHGPNGGDEVNLIEAGGNYGWPTHSFGRNYDGTALPGRAQGDGVVDPLLVWLPSIAVSGLLFYTGEAFPAWQGNLFVGSGRRGGIDGTGGLERVVLGDNLGELRRETLLTPLHQRVRDIAQGPDGLLYVLTDGPEHAVLRLAPAPLP